MQLISRNIKNIITYAIISSCNKEECFSIKLHASKFLNNSVCIKYMRFVYVLMYMY